MPNLSFFKMQGTLIEVVDKWCREHLPTKVSELENDVGYLTEATIPAPNDGVLTIKRNDSSLGTFSANQSANESINITVPTDASEISYGNVTVEDGLSNRTLFIDIPAKSGNNVSEFIGAVSSYLYSQGYNTGTYTFHCLWTDNYQTHGQIQFLSNGGQYAIIEIAQDLYTMNYTPNVSRNIYKVNYTQI